LKSFLFTIIILSNTSALAQVQDGDAPLPPPKVQTEEMEATEGAPAGPFALIEESQPWSWCTVGAASMCIGSAGGGAAAAVVVGTAVGVLIAGLAADDSIVSRSSAGAAFIYLFIAAPFVAAAAAIVSQTAGLFCASGGHNTASRWVAMGAGGLSVLLGAPLGLLVGASIGGATLGGIVGVAAALALPALVGSTAGMITEIMFGSEEEVERMEVTPFGDNSGHILDKIPERRVQEGMAF
jgi:hypothetical protein